MQIRDKTKPFEVPFRFICLQVNTFKSFAPICTSEVTRILNCVTEMAGATHQYWYKNQTGTVSRILNRRGLFTTLLVDYH